MEHIYYTLTEGSCGGICGIVSSVEYVAGKELHEKSAILSL